MKTYSIITVGILDGKKYEYETEFDTANEAIKGWEEAKEEVNADKENWDKMTIKLMSYEVESDKVSEDPEWWSSYIEDEAELLTYSI